jgi:hypothetical protein
VHVLRDCYDTALFLAANCVDGCLYLGNDIYFS